MNVYRCGVCNVTVRDNSDATATHCSRCGCVLEQNEIIREGLARYMVIGPHPLHQLEWRVEMLVGNGYIPAGGVFSYWIDGEGEQFIQAVYLPANLKDQTIELNAEFDLTHINDAIGRILLRSEGIS